MKYQYRESKVSVNTPYIKKKMSKVYISVLLLSNRIPSIISYIIVFLYSISSFTFYTYRIIHANNHISNIEYDRMHPICRSITPFK